MVAKMVVGVATTHCCTTQLLLLLLHSTIVTKYVAVMQLPTLVCLLFAFLARVVTEPFS